MLHRSCAVYRKGIMVAAAAVLAAAGWGAPAQATAFDQYQVIGTVTLPAGSNFGVLTDGRLVTTVGNSLYAETATGSGQFTNLGPIPGADLPGFGGAAFLRVSPDGTRLAIGNNGGSSFSNYQVGIVNLSNLSTNWYPLAHFDAAWADNQNLAVAGGAFGSPSTVTLLDTTSPPASPVKKVVINNIGGASSGIAFDTAGDLFTGNGYDYAPTGSNTGDIKGFTHAAWTAALGGSPLDFEASGRLITNVLSASPLVFDNAGDLAAGGGGGASGFDYDNMALIRAASLQAALAGGAPLDGFDPYAVRRFDPDTAGFDFYTVNYNPVTGVFYAQNFGSPTLAELGPVPEPASAALAGLALASLGLTLLRRDRRA